MSNIKPTNVENFIAEIDGGLVNKLLAHILSDVADSCLSHQDKGKVSITFEMKPAKRLDQIEIAYKLGYQAPKANGGDRRENTPGETLMYVSKGGKLTTYPENQGDMFQDQHD